MAGAPDPTLQSVHIDAGWTLPAVSPAQVPARATAFVSLAVLLSWTPLGILLATGGDHTAGAGSLLLWWLGGLGPGLAAILLTWRHEGREGLHRIAHSVTRWRLGRQGWLLLVPLPVGLLGVSIVVARGHASWEVAEPRFLLLLPVLLIGGVLFGGLEEIGWRGHLQPLLQARMSGLTAAVVVGVTWSVWHAPLFLLTGTTQAATSRVWFTIGGVALAVLFAWVWNLSRGNLLLLILLHGALNGSYSAVVQGLAPDALGAGFDRVTAVTATVLAVLVIGRVGRHLGTRPPEPHATVTVP